MIRIVVSKWGHLDPQQVESLLDVMHECYRRLEPHDVLLVDLLLFETSSSMEAFLAGESEELKVLSERFDERFFAMHDAWRGTPRIIVCFERMRELDESAWKGVVRHEVGHSILHGSSIYYRFTIPQTLLELKRRFNLSQELLFNLLYLISIAVKDHQVTRLLISRGYVDDQWAYVKRMLSPSGDDIEAWMLSERRPEVQILCLIGRLKDLSCATPMLEVEVLRNMVQKGFIEGLSYLPRKLSMKLLHVTYSSSKLIGEDVFEAVDKVTALVSKELMEPVLAGGGWLHGH